MQRPQCFVLGIAAVVCAAACSGVPSPATVAAARIGAPPPREVAIKLAEQAFRAKFPELLANKLVFGDLEQGFYGLRAGSRNQRYAWQLAVSVLDPQSRMRAIDAQSYLFFFLGERLVATALPDSTWTGRGYRSSYRVEECDGGGLTPEQAGVAREVPIAR